MSTLSLETLLADTGGNVRGVLPRDAGFPRIERNSREIVAGDLFIAVQGERFDGHDFVEAAAQNGALAALVRRSWADVQTEPSLPLIVVDEPVEALQRLATARRARLPGLTVVGITGSVGKTSTKEVVAAVLGARYRTYRNPGNLNTEIGLPLCLMELVDETEVAVLEMGGAYAFGELALLAGIARPTIGVVTNIYPVHLERMGSIEAITETKTELVEALPDDGVAVLNGDDPRGRAMAARTRARVITYGLGQANDVRADEVSTEGLAGTSFRLHLDGETFYVKVPLVGGHAVQLALAGIAVGHAMGMHISEMLPGFDDPSIQVRLLVMPGPNDARLIDDTYNASTPSVLSALGLLAELTPARAIAVLGEMRELGDLADEEHRIVGRRVGEVADVLVTFGDLARIVAAEAVVAAELGGRLLEVTSFGLDERAALIAHLRATLRAGDIVLLKGSRGLQMEEIVAALRTDTKSDPGGGDVAPGIHSSPDARV